MVADRGATRDYLDVAALGDLLGEARATQALAPLSQLYENLGTETATMRFAQAAMNRPVDADEVDLRAYRGLAAPYQDLEYILRRVREWAVPALERELGTAHESPIAGREPEQPPSSGQQPRHDGSGSRKPLMKQRREHLADELAESPIRSRPGRVTAQESFLDLVDDLAQGDLETWRRIYAAALHDQTVRAAVERATRLVDQDFASAGALWQALIERMPPAVARGPCPPPVSRRS